MSQIETEVFEDADQIADVLARRVIEIAHEAISARGKCVIALAGGSTPRKLYQRLASDGLRDQIDWQNVHLFLGDERYVPNDHEDSNFRMAQETLLGEVAVPPSQVHAVPTNLEAIHAAAKYEKMIRETFNADEGAVPSFDLILLGIGGDAHTASLFPGTAALAVTDRLVIENWVPQLDTMRITFTIPLIHAAANIILMASGAYKAEAIERAIQGPEDLNGAPSQCIRGSRGSVYVALDTAAAARLL